jgi:hypothetical protein
MHDTAQVGACSIATKSMETGAKSRNRCGAPYAQPHRMADLPTRSLFRRLVLAALAVPAVPLIAACGGQVQSTPTDGDVADAAGEVAPDGASCAPQQTDIGCGFTMTYPCGLPDQADQPVSQARCLELCPGDSGVFSCWLQAPDSGAVTTVQCTNCAVGRRPVGWARGRHERGRGCVAAWLAEIAELEGAAVEAFDVMRVELAAHGAPRRLRVEAGRARRDEIRHASVMARLARRHGGRPRGASTPRVAIRPLEAIALENATEGCVRETWGALFAAFQAERASDPALRRAFARIAGDEARHAALSWRLHRWALGRLGRDARARVEAARADATAKLRAEIAVEPPLALAAIAGVPRAHEAARLFDAMVVAVG